MLEKEKLESSNSSSRCRCTQASYGMISVYATHRTRRFDCNYIQNHIDKIKKCITQCTIFDLGYLALGFRRERSATLRTSKMSWCFIGSKPTSHDHLDSKQHATLLYTQSIGSLSATFTYPVDYHTKQTPGPGP